MRQHTIRKPVGIEGIGLHSGKVARVTLSPALPDAGVAFKVRSTGERIAARPESVVNSHYATTVGANGTRIQTVEHLMAAVAGLGIDNLDIEVDGPEIPALDGSAKPFVALLALAGLAQQSARRRPLALPCPLRAHVIARNGGHALNIELVLAIQRAVGLERRAAVAVPARADAAAASTDAARRDGFVPAPGLAAI